MINALHKHAFVVSDMKKSIYLTVDLGLTKVKVLALNLDQGDGYKPYSFPLVFGFDGGLSLVQYKLDGFKFLRVSLGQKTFALNRLNCRFTSESANYKPQKD
jgi:hypothetical protein